MEITQQNSCVKYILPDGRFLDVLTDVFDEMYKWLQNEANSPESGGYIVGYQHDITKTECMLTALIKRHYYSQL